MKLYGNQLRASVSSPVMNPDSVANKCAAAVVAAGSCASSASVSTTAAVSVPSCASRSARSLATCGVRKLGPRGDFDVSGHRVKVLVSQTGSDHLIASAIGATYIRTDPLLHRVSPTSSRTPPSSAADGCERSPGESCEAWKDPTGRPRRGRDRPRDVVFCLSYFPNSATPKPRVDHDGAMTPGQRPVSSRASRDLWCRRRPGASRHTQRPLQRNGVAPRLLLCQPDHQPMPPMQIEL
jgi:hypothetical protein